MMTRQELETKLIGYSWEDEEFFAKLQSDPKAVVEEVSGEKLPDDLKINILQESSDQMCIVIPPKPLSSDFDEEEELTSDQLQTISGGQGFNFNVFSFVKPGTWMLSRLVGKSVKWAKPVEKPGISVPDVW